MIVLPILQDVGQVTTLCHLPRFLFLPQIFLPIIVDFVLATEVHFEQLLVLLFSGKLVLIDGSFCVSVQVGEIDEVISALLYVLLTEFDDGGLAILFDLIYVVLVQILLLTSGNITGAPDFLSLEKDALAPVECPQFLLEHRLSSQRLDLPCLLFLFAPVTELGAGLRFPEVLSIMSMILRRERRLVSRTTKNKTSNKQCGHP